MSLQRSLSPSCWLMIILFSMLPLLSCTRTDDSSWLVGQWQVTYNPAHDDEDRLIFLDGEQIRIEMSDGRKVEGHYRVINDDLILTLAVPKRPTEVHFRVSPDHQRLIFKNGAYYQRQK